MKGKRSFELAVQDQFANTLFVEKHLALVMCGPAPKFERTLLF